MIVSVESFPNIETSFLLYKQRPFHCFYEAAIVYCRLLRAVHYSNLFRQRPNKRLTAQLILAEPGHSHAFRFIEVYIHSRGG
jgi:hypothetical protein